MRYFTTGLHKGKECVSHAHGLETEEQAEIHAAKMEGDHHLPFCRIIEAESYMDAWRIITAEEKAKKHGINGERPSSIVTTESDAADDDGDDE